MTRAERIAGIIARVEKETGRPWQASTSADVPWLLKELQASERVIAAFRVRLRREIEEWPALVAVLDAYDKRGGE